MKDTTQKRKIESKIENIRKSLTSEEKVIFQKINTPIKIQNFLDTLPFNFEKDVETYYSPREVLKNKKAHCLEGALLAALALWLHGDQPLILDLKAPKEIDHVIAIYFRNGFYGAISKTNHACLRFRDPVYKTVRELVLSYYHEYFDNKTGKKLLMQYSNSINLSKQKIDWTISGEKLDWIVDVIEDAKHYNIVTPKNMKLLRPADKVERKAGEITEWD